MPRCTFCGIEVPKGTGKMYVYASGKIANFCKSKCEKNYLKLRRKPLTVKWTEQYRKEHKKGVKGPSRKELKKEEMKEKQRAEPEEETEVSKEAAEQ